MQESLRITDLKVYPFDAADKAPLSEVGGKGLSLIQGTQAGLPVPGGFVLSVDFFSPWLTSLKNSLLWLDFLHAANDNDLQKACDALKSEALRQSFTTEQKAVIAAALQGCKDWNLFAVRSSSPEEDLEGSSFAGGYETILGVTAATLEDAIRRAFASCLDRRVVIYKRQNGFDTTDPKIAVIVQRQIASEIAGVGFSLNPVTNNYDEAVFNANWGLGETVVAGMATPDTFTFDKVAMKVRSKTLGKKQLSIWLKPSGGTEQKQNYRSGEPTLSDEQVLLLGELIKTVEELYSKPMDIEWAFFEDKLFLLQARPITAYVPLPPEMITLPWQKKRLYMDATISVQGLYKPLSKMGTSVLSAILKTAGQTLFRVDFTRDINTALPWVSQGRLYLNLSKAFEFAGKRRVVEFLANMDPLTSRAIDGADENEYLPEKKRNFFFPLVVLWRLRRPAWQMLQARLWPQRAHRRSQEAFRQFLIDARAMADDNKPIGVFVDELFRRLIKTIFSHGVPLFAISRLCLWKMKDIARNAGVSEAGKLELSLPNNPTTEMGLALYHVSEFLPDNLDGQKLGAGLSAKSLPPQFLAAWEKFLAKYGHRGPAELDVASPRYCDRPQLLLDILMGMRIAGQGENPQQKFDRGRRERQQAYETILLQIRSKSPMKARRFVSLYRVFATLGGYREVPKFYLIFANYLLRQRILKEADLLCDAHRLDRPEQVFDLTLADLERGLADKSLDLRELGKANRAFIDRLARVPQLPAVIDSRGLILRPPSAALHKGEVVGTPISAGIVRGRIKVLAAPDEKPFNKGEILVARATDPGWTPLFVNAGGVILEVGGLLQHGALVAREYGLPCVAGIMNATTLWKDGTTVELDGSAGIVRVIDEAH